MASSSSSSSSSPSPVLEQERFGALPESILSHILSFLPTMFAVRTSVLSKRWRTLWTSVGVLDLDEDNEFFFFKTGKRIRVTKWEIKNRSGFAEFVGKVLSFHHTPKLLKLRLNCCSQNYPLKDWVRTAVSREVQTLDLRLPWYLDPVGKAGQLPPLLFTSQSLVDLRLDLGGSALILPGTLALVGLRRMRLYRVKFCDDHSTCSLFSSSTALRSLVLENCDYQKLGCLKISCSSLQELVIHSTLLEADGLGSCQVKIAASQLSSFVYYASLAQLYVVKPLSCVDCVKIQFQRFETQKGYLEKLSMLNRTRSFFSSLSSARNLDICPVCVKALRYRKIPFRNLNVLRTAVKHPDSNALSVVLRFLLFNRHLRALIVEVLDLSMLPSSARKDDFLKGLGAWPGAVEKVEIRCREYSTVAAGCRKVTSYTTSESVLELVKFLPGSQEGLKKLILSTRLFCVIDDGYNSPSSRVRDAVIEKVLSFPRRNRELALVFI